MEKYNGKSNSNQQMPSFLQAIGAIPGAPRQSGASSMRSSQTSGINQPSSFHLQGSSSRPTLSTSSLPHHQLPSDSTLQGGKTVHHMGQLGIQKIKTKDHPVVKIEVGLNPSTSKKQRRSSSNGDGTMRSGSDTTSSDFAFPPIKKIKLEIGDVGTWETKEESEEISLTNISGAVGEIIAPSRNEKMDDGDYDDGCAVDYKSRCVILIEEEMQNIVKDFKACTTELFYLENDGNILDYYDWSKKPNSSLNDYLDKMAAKHEVTIKGIESEEAKVFTSGLGTLPTITPVAISKRLPPAIAALQQKQNQQNELTGGIPLSTTAATTTIGSPTPLNSSENAPGSSRLATVTIATGNHQGGLVRPIPIVAVPSSVAGLVTSSLKAHASYQSYIDPTAIITHSTISMTTTPIMSSVVPLQTSGVAKQLDANDEPLEAMVMNRVSELRQQGMWSMGRLPKIVEPERSKSHWDVLLDDAAWMAVDFALERRWKIAASGMIARSVVRSEAVAKRMTRKRNEEDRKRKLASGVSRIVEDFWSDAMEEFLLKNHVEKDKERKNILERIIVSTSKDLLEVEENLVSNIDPNLYPNSESGESYDHEQEINELLTSAEWPVGSVLRQYYPKLFEEALSHNNKDGDDDDCEQTNDLELFDNELLQQEIPENLEDTLLVDNIKRYESVDAFLLDIPKMDEIGATSMPDNNLFIGEMTLRPYQISEAMRLIKFHHKGMPYLDIRDPGLGTKLQIAYHISSLATNFQEWGCHLVVTREKSDLYSWHSTFAKVTPSMRVKVVMEELKDYNDAAALKYSLKEAVDHFNVFVTFSDHLVQYSEIYRRYNWKTIVMDKVIDLNSPKNANAIISCLNDFSYRHLIVFLQSLSTPPEIISLVATDDDDDEEGKMDVSSFKSESLMELVALTLKGKIVDSSPEWRGIIPTLKNQPIIHLTEDEAMKVFRSLSACTVREKVVNQLNALNVLTLACPLPIKQAAKYNEIFGELLEESPDVTSQKFLNQINELFNTCAHLDEFRSDQSHSFFLHMISPLTSDPYPSSLELLNERVDDKDLPNSLKHLLTLYCWGMGLVDEIEHHQKQNHPSSNLMEDRPYNLSLLKSLANCQTNRNGASNLEIFDWLKQVVTEVEDGKILDDLPDDVVKSFWNVLFLKQPLSCRDNLFPQSSFEVEVKEEMMDYSYGDEMVRSGEPDGEEVFEELGSNYLKELTSVGNKYFKEELKKFLMSYNVVIAHLLERASMKHSGWSKTKRLITQLVESGNDPTNKIEELDYVDQKIIGQDKGKLSSLSSLLDKEGMNLKGQRFVVLTCHRSTTFELQSLFSSKGITYVCLDSSANANKVRRSVLRFNSSAKYICLIVHHTNSSSDQWRSFLRILGPDLDLSAGNLVVLDEELADNTNTLLWQLMARNMSSSRDLNLIRVYHAGSIEGYQVQLRWSEETLGRMVQGRGFNARMERFDRLWSDGRVEADFQQFITENRMGDDDDDEGLEFIYTSHQDALKHSTDEVMTRHCSCLDEYRRIVEGDDDDDNENDYELLMSGVKQKEIQSYAVDVINRQLKSSEMSMKRREGSSGRVSIGKLLNLKDEVLSEDDDPNTYEARTYDDLLTYEVDYMDPECFISDLTGEKMPVWAPPTPPHDDDVYVDRNLLLLYESTAMPETQLPNIYARKGNKKMKMDELGRNIKSSREFRHDPLVAGMQRPKSMFERPLNSTQANNPASAVNNSSHGYQVDRDGRLFNKAGIPVGQPNTRSPNPEAQDQFDWLIHEDWALLQAYQMTCLDYNLQPESTNPNQPPPQSRLPNWELIACIINGFSRVFRSARQSRLRHENVIVPREEGRSQFDNSQRKLKKTSKGLYKTKSNRQLKTIQMYSQDNNHSLTTHLSHRFDLLRNTFGKINIHKTSVPNPLTRTNHAAIMAENNINYDQPLSAFTIAELKLERASKEKEKRAIVAPERIQQTPPITTPSTSLVNAALAIQQQQQQTTSEGLASTPLSTPLSTSLTVPIGGGLSVVLPTSQLRMAVPTVVGNQQQQVILQAAQQQMAIVASGASNSLVGKVPLGGGGVGASIPTVRNLTNLSFVMNQSAVSNQQSTTFVTVSKAQGTVSSTVGIVTSLNPATLRAIRNISPANQLVSGININQNKATPSGPAVAFPSGRIAIRGAGTIQLNQRLTQKPPTPHQQVTLTPGGNLTGIQKVANLGVVSVPTTQMGQTFHVKNPQVLLKQKQPSAGMQQLAGSNVVGRLTAGSTNQGTALQLQHLQLQSKTPQQLLEVMQTTSGQQQIIAANLSSAQVSGINVTALIKTVSANSNLGKVVAPAQTAIRQTQGTKRPTVTAINIQGQGNRTALMVAKGSSQVIYQQPKLVLQSQSAVKQQQHGVQLPQGTAILAMTPRGPAVNISALGLGSTIATGTGMAIPINPSNLTPASGQQVRMAKQMINSPKVTPLVQHITVRAPTQQLANTTAVGMATSVTITTAGMVVRPQQNPPSSSA